MITAKSTPEEVLKELKDGYAKAKYWHIKHYGGEKKYELMRNALLGKKDNSSGDVVEYIDRNGNRWRIFESSRYYKEVNECYSSVVAFVYHETFGSCGAYVVGFHKELVDGNPIDVMDAINYTEHFFLRFCDRLKIAYKSSAMIKKFLEVCPCVTIQPREDFEGKFRKADFALPASLGRGVIKEYGNSRIFEVRTFLTNVQLSRKQKRETEKLREASKLNKYEPKEVRLKKALDMGLSNYLDNEVERLSAIGYKNAEELMMMQLMCVLPVINLGMIDERDFDACQRFGYLVLEEIQNAVYRIGCDDFQGYAPLEALRIIKLAGKKMKRKFDLKKCCDYIMKEMYHDEKNYGNIEESVEKYEKDIEKFNNGYLQSKAK